MSVYPVTLDHDLYPGDLVALEFLEAAIAEDGDLTYGDDSAVGDFESATSAPTSTMMAQAKAFWEAGVAEAAGGAAVKGFSTATPREYFDCFISDSGGGTGTWQYYSSAGGVSTITSQNYALALRGWYAVYGYDATVAATWAWLLAATSNVTFETSVTASKSQIAEGKTGTYAPGTCLATVIDVVSGGAAVNRNGSDLYNWATVGLLAELRTAQDLANFRESKREASKMRRRNTAGTPGDERHEMPSLRGRTGLTFQTFFTETILSAARRVYDVVAAAMFGLSYRQEPKIHTVKDHMPHVRGN